MSVRGGEGQQVTEQAQKVAQRISAKDYFLAEEEKIIDEWANKSVKLFKFTGQVLKSQYEARSSGLVQNFSQNYDALYNQSKKEFQAYCILNRKVQKKGDEIENFAAFFNSKNHKNTFFQAWKQYTAKNKYLRKMQERCDKYNQTRTLKVCLKQWHNITMSSNRNKIKNEVLQKTEIEISKIQQDYEKLIKSMEEVLEKKLIQLKKEEEEHKLLHDKYENMYSKAKLQSI